MYLDFVSPCPKSSQGLAHRNLCCTYIEFVFLFSLLILYVYGYVYRPKIYCYLIFYNFNIYLLSLLIQGNVVYLYSFFNNSFIVAVTLLVIIGFLSCISPAILLSSVSHFQWSDIHCLSQYIISSLYCGMASYRISSYAVFSY
jgi:hypothetical protein